MNHNDESICKACNKLMDPVLYHDIRPVGASRYTCYNFACPARRGGIWTRSVLQNDTGIVEQQTTRRNDGSYYDMAEGRPSQGEANVEKIAKAFIYIANRDFGTDYDGFEPGPNSSQRETGHDCAITSSCSNVSLKLQITRALPADEYQKQGEDGRRAISITAEDAAGWIMKAIEKKTSRASPCIALVIDGMDVPPISFMADAIAVPQNRQVLDAQKWHSIWVIGPLDLRQLGGYSIPKID